MMRKSTPIKSPAYLQWIRTQPCMVCGQYSEAHHIKGHKLSGVGLKCSDLASIPLCHEHHMDLHQHGWQTWERGTGISQEEAVKKILWRALKEGVI